MSKYYKNFILCGDIDFFCLLCEESYQLLEDIDKHVRWEKHRKLIKGLEYFPKFKKEQVYKLVSRYYCEGCNFATHKFATIKQHIKEESHIIKRDIQLTELPPPQAKRELIYVRIGNNLVLLNEWQGLLNKQCVICQVAFEDVDDHVGLSSHMVNLIQAKVKAIEGHFYRKLSNESFYCFECKKVAPINALTEHWSNEDHMALKTATAESNAPKKYFEIDTKNDVAICKICKKTVLISYIPMSEHAEIHKKDSEEFKEELFRYFRFLDHGKMRHELKLFGQQHQIKLISGGAKGYCNICFTYISSHMRNFKQHVNGERHIGFLELKGLILKTKKPEKIQYRTKPLLKFIEKFVHLKEYDVFWLNKELCIEIMSFMYLCPLEHDKDKVRCYICEEIVASDVVAHFHDRHRVEYKNSEVITSLEREFVRVIRPSVYHCGFCNQIFPSWGVLQKHLNSWKHRGALMSAHQTLKVALANHLNCPEDDIHRLSTVELD